MTLAENFESVATSHLGLFQRMAARAGAESVEDAVQDAFLIAHRNLATFRGESMLSTWIGTIVVNCARMQRRKLKNEHLRVDPEIEEHVLETAPETDPNPEQLLMRRENRAILRELMASLSPRLRQTLELQLADLNIEDTARHLTIPIGTVKARRSRALRCLQKYARKKKLAVN